MTIPVHTKSTLSNVAWPSPPSNKIQSNSNQGADRHKARLPYSRSSGNARSHDPLFKNKKRVIIAHNGKSFAAPAL